MLRFCRIGFNQPVVLRVARRQPVLLRNASTISSLPPKVQAFVEEARQLCQPDSVYVCNGSEEENTANLKALERKGVITALNPKYRPNSYLARSCPEDVARAENNTFICSETKAKSGPTNNWAEPTEMRSKLNGLFKGCMKGREMHVICYSMGPVGSPLSKIGVQVTDNPYVTANMRIMTRIGANVVKALGDDDFVRCMHSVGVPLEEGDKDSVWPCNIPNRNVCHFPETEEIWSFGSAYGGNALLGKKCFALRIASAQAQREGWMAEHMLILGVTNPAGVKRYIAAAFPSACGKTNLAMMRAQLPGWDIRTVGDDIAWMRISKEDGHLYAINPENGFFGVAPGTSNKSNPNAMKTIEKNTLFTNVALTTQGDVFWQGMYKKFPEGMTDWLGNKNWRPNSETKLPAHGNSRFTTPIQQCPTLDPEWENPNGVRIDAIIFGSRRSTTMPLVFESRNWQHGTFLGASMRSEPTGASEVDELAHDPMAMRAFIGYNVKDYFQHWLEMGNKTDKMPKIFHVNWFRRHPKGDTKKGFIWPGFGDNIRALEWIFDRVDGTAAATETAIGLLPTDGSIKTEGIPEHKLDKKDMQKLFLLDRSEWEKEAKAIRKYFTEELMEDDSVAIPKPLMDELEKLESGVKNM